MNLITVTKIFPNGKVTIVTKRLRPGTCITDLVSKLNRQIATGILCSYEIELVNHN